MNKIELLDILNSYIVTKQLNDNKLLSGATTNIEQASDKDIVFYFLHENERAEAALAKRLESANPGIIITNRDSRIYKKRDRLIVSDFLESQRLVADALYPNLNKLKIVGVTGTNGKTTTVNLAVQLAKQAGKKAFSIGTLGVYDEDKEIYPTPNATTPSYLEIRKIIHHFQESYDFIFMEVSSHALVQKRLYDQKIIAAGWTSFSQDHLDYHKDIDDYFEAKTLIRDLMEKNEPIYVPFYEKELQKKLKNKNINYKEIEEKDLNRSSVPASFKPLFNYNNLSLAKALVTKITGFESFDLEKLKLPKGRFSTYKIGECLFVIDYAHTPDALVNICSSIKEAFPKSKLITVFGCGGDRDRTKRPLMGKAACEYSDVTIVTTDNPRFEDPEQIIEDVIPGLDKNYHLVTKREEAIKKAFDLANGETIILIAGKGHEEYQDIMGTKIDFSDFDVVEKLKRGLNV